MVHAAYYLIIKTVHIVLNNGEKVFYKPQMEVCIMQNSNPLIFQWNFRYVYLFLNMKTPRPKESACVL